MFFLLPLLFIRIKENPAPSEYLWGLSAGYKLRMSVRGIGNSLASAECFDTSQDKKYSNTALLSVRIPRFCKMNLPPGYTLVSIDATGQTWGREIPLTQKKDTNVFCTLISFIVPYVGVPKGI